MPIDCYGLHPAASTSLTVKYVFFLLVIIVYILLLFTVSDYLFKPLLLPRTLLYSYITCLSYVFIQYYSSIICLSLSGSFCSATLVADYEINTISTCLEK